MWWLLLVLGVIAVPAEADYESYGCKFKDSKSLVVLENEKPTYLDEYRRVKFGQRMPRAITFDIGYGALDNFMSFIKGVYEETMEKYLFTDFPEFYRFYDKYDIERKRMSSFKDFYESFSYDFNCNSASSYSLAIKLIEELLRQNKNLAQHVYLVAVYENKRTTPEVFIRERNNYPEQYIISNVAVLFRIKYGPNTPGVILMDMGYKPFGPTKVMMSSAIETDDLYRWSLQWDSTREFIYVDKCPLEKIVTNIYYTAKPYCSFATTTFKRQLLANTTKSIIRRNKKGDPTVSISFDVTEEDPKFKMTTYEENRPPKTMDIKFRDLRRMNENQKSHYDEVLNKFQFSSSYQKESWEAYLDRAVDISKNREFIKEYKEFLPKLQLK